MRQRLWLGVVIVLAIVFGGRAWAEGEAEEHHEAEHHEAAPAAEEHHEAAPAAEHHDAAPAAEHHDAAPADETDDDGDDDDGAAGGHYDEFDVDGDGHEDTELKKEYEEAFAGIPKFDDKSAEAEEAALEARPEDAELRPSMTVDQFRKAVRVVKKVVLDRMEAKMARKSAKKLRNFAVGIFFFSLAGVFLLAVPLFVRKHYPGKDGLLFKYSALAAVTFFVTVNLFGAVLVGMRTVQTGLGAATNPSLAIAAGTFDTLDRNADEYIVMGKELFMPTLEALKGNSDEQPSVVILENGQRLIKDAKVFVSIAHMFKKIDFIFKVLPIVLFALTMVLFGIAIRPTLTEIIRLPMRAASGEAGVGREVTRKALRRVWGELLATLCTIGVLVGLTLISAMVLGTIVGPALDTLLGYFSRAIEYLQFVDGASSGLVFLTLFAVILFLVMNLAALILSMAFFLGKSQKIFQQKFNEGRPLATHKRFFTWGLPAVLLVQVLPLVYAFVVDKILMAIDHKLLDGVVDADQVPWGKLMLAGPFFLVIGFVAVFWAARGVKAIAFLQKYKVNAPAQAFDPN